MVKRDHCLVARLALRDMAKDDLSVFVDDGGLVVEGERAIQEKRDDQGATETTYARFRRPIPLTDGVSPEDVKATFTDGVLELTVPAPATAAARQPRQSVDRGRARTRATRSSELAWGDAFTGSSRRSGSQCFSLNSL